MPTLPRQWRRLGLLATIVLAGFAAIVAALILPSWLDLFLVPSRPRRILIAALVAMEYAYLAAAGAAALGAALLGLALCGPMRRRRARPLRGRGLLACASCLLAFVLAEGSAAGWRAWTDPGPAPTPAEPGLPDHFPEPDVDGESTIVVLGGSSAEGMPYNAWLSVGRIVAWQLGRVMPSRRFRLEQLARAGERLADQYRRLADTRRRPDLLIIYSGHNEFSAGLPWSRRVHHYLDEPPARIEDFEERAARLSSVCGLIHETAERHRIALRPRIDIIPPLVDVPSFTPSEYAERLRDFRQRLESLVAFGERQRIATVLVIPPGNDAGFDPNRSFLPPDTPRAERAAFARDFLAVRRSEESDAEGAIAAYRALLDRRPGFAEAHYRLGRLLARRGDVEAASREFEAARDRDGLPMRCPSDFQRAYREVADAHRDGCILIDGQALFRALGRRGQLDDDLFHDAMHPSLRGHLALAQAILDALCAQRSLGWPEGIPAPVIDPAGCAAYFGMTPGDWPALAQRGAMFYFAVAPLRYDWSQRIDKRNAFMKAAARIARGEPPEAVGLPNLGIPRAGCRP